MNAPTSFGPLLSEEMEDRDLSVAQRSGNIANTFAEAEMRNMKNKARRKKTSLLENFEGRTNTPEFRDKMMSVDPDMVMKMEEGIRQMDETQRDRMKDYMGQVAARAEMAKTPQAWQEEGFAVPFEQRDRILGATLTYQQAYDRTKEAGGGAGGGSDGGLKAADENAIHRYTQDLFEGIYNPATGGFMGFKKDTSRQQAAKIGAEASRIVTNNPNITLHEAVMQAAQTNGVEIIPINKTGPAGRGGNDPMGLR